MAGLSTFPWQALVGGVLPLAAGIVIGNLDREMRDFLGRVSPTLIPFFAFALGTPLDLTRIWQAGLLGLLMGVGVVLISGIVLVIADRLSGGNGTAGIGAASTAGNAAAVPALVAAPTRPTPHPPVLPPPLLPPASWSPACWCRW